MDEPVVKFTLAADKKTVTVESISLRDLFAAFALTGLLASPTRAGAEAVDNAAKAADWSYCYADAMLKQRAATNESEVNQ